MILLYIVIFILIAVIATVFASYAGIRVVGIKVSLSNAIKLTIVLLVIQAVATLPSYLIGDNPVTIIVWLGGLVGSFIAWHKFLDRYYGVTIGKSLGA